MPIDYDKIVEGRRRNWESLKPEEMRAREREEEREKQKEEREKKGKEGYFALRQRLKDEAAKTDRKNFMSATRQGIILGGAFLLILGAWIGVTHYIESRRLAAQNNYMRDVQTVIEQGKIVADQKTPIGAFATWRSAWKRGDVPQIVRLFSTRFLSKTSELKNSSEILAEFQRLYKTGRLAPNREIASSFSGAEIIRIPKAPYRNEELALFRSKRVVKSGGKYPISLRYIVAFSYNKSQATWHFADVREDKYFSILWDAEAAIKPLKSGPGTITYDETGKQIDSSMRPAAASPEQQAIQGSRARSPKNPR